MAEYIERHRLLDSMAKAMRELSVDELTDPDDWVAAAERVMRGMCV